MLQSHITFHFLQQLNERIYGPANRKNYPDTLELPAKILFHATRLFDKGVSKNNLSETIRNAVMVHSWQNAFANRLGLQDVHKQLRRHFKACPYCIGKPCGCKGGTKPPRQLFTYIPTHGDDLVDVFQKHLALVYPDNTLHYSADKLVSESAELMEAYMSLRRNKTEDTIRHFWDEFCDVQARLVAVAHCAQFSLAKHVHDTFVDGCDVCGGKICTKCSYTEIGVHSRTVSEKP